MFSGLGGGRLSQALGAFHPTGLKTEGPFSAEGRTAAGDPRRATGMTRYSSAGPLPRVSPGPAGRRTPSIERGRGGPGSLAGVAAGNASADCEEVKPELVRER